MDGQVLHWSGRVVTAEDLRRHLNGHRELVLPSHAVITPLAQEHLWNDGVQVTRRPPEEKTPSRQAWGYSQDRPHQLVGSAVKAVERDGVVLRELKPGADDLPCRWARALAECVAAGQCQGGVVFCQDPGLVCCVANKVTGLRAVAVTAVPQAGRALLTLAANLIAVEMPGRTFFELRQIFRTLCRPEKLVCPPGVACTIEELEGHAHR